MDQLLQIQNINKQELISILENVVENKLNEVASKSKPQSYTVQEASKLLKVSELTIYNYIKRGMLPSTKIGRKHVIKKEALQNALVEVKSLKYRRDV